MRMQRFFAIILVALAASVCVACNTTPLTPTVTKPAQDLGEPIEVEEKVDDPFIVEVPGDDWNNTLPTVDTSVQYDYTDVSFGTAHGAFTEAAGTFTSYKVRPSLMYSALLPGVMGASWAKIALAAS